MNDPWVFGSNQLLTLLGMVITVVIAISGFRSLGRWRREQLEGKRIDVALEALTIGYKTKFVFEHIRNAMASSAEWTDMPNVENDSEDKRRRRGAFYAVFKRIEHNKDFFDSLWQLQPRFMAVFGPETESTFLKAHKARVNIEVAAQMLYQQALEASAGDEQDESTRALYKKLRGDIWGGMNKALRRDDEIGMLTEQFKKEIETICLPVVAELRRGTYASEPL